MKKKEIKKVCITYPPFEYNNGYPLISLNRQFQWLKNPSYAYPMLPSYAATLLKNNGINVVFLDTIASNITTIDWFNNIDDIAPDLIFFEVKTPIINYIWDTIEAVKESYINALEILTGVNIDNGLIKPEYTEITDYTIKRPELTYFSDKIDILEASKKNINASYMPTFDLFFSAGYGRPGLDMLDNSFQPYYIAGIKMDWTIAGFYTGERNKKIIELNKKSLELEKQTFLFNTNIDIQNQQAKIKQIKDTMSYDDEIVKLRTSIKNSSEIKMKQGTMTVNDYMREVTAENLAKQGKILHEIELLQAVYEMKNIINQ